MTDPWKHRSAEMTCATCMWFVEKASSQSTLSEDDIEGAWTAGFKKALDSVGTATLDIPEATLRNNWMDETFAEDNVRVLFGRCRAMRQRCKATRQYSAMTGAATTNWMRISDNQMSSRETAFATARTRIRR